MVGAALIEEINKVLEPKYKIESGGQELPYTH